MNGKTAVNGKNGGWLAGIVSGLGIGIAVYAAFLRPWHVRWGATDDEVVESLPGDELVPDSMATATHAITIHAPVEEVWPWLVQIGQDKGGFYSYSWLENMVGCHLHNANRILPEFQLLKAGDPVRLHPNAPPLRAVIVEPYRGIVLRGEPKEAAEPTEDGTWAFYVRPIDGTTTRLLIRSRWTWKPGLRAWFGYRCLLEPAHFIMERKMLQGIKARAEHTGCFQPAADTPT